MLGLRPDFFEPTYDDVLTDKNKLHAESDIDSNSEEDVDQPLTLEDLEADDDVED